MSSVAPVSQRTGRWTPGSLVRARGREWIVLTGSDAAQLRLRPLAGSEQDQTVLHLALEPDPVTDASFPLPSLEQRAGQEAALLLRDALVLSLRRGAGPFRSFGQISVEPRAYQLVPLLMALRQDTVRLLVADDVGVGKTIEAALIARELLDRGDIERVAILCPPHLVDQWVGELTQHFHLHPVAVTAGGAARLERNLPQGESIFTTHPHTVVSLDYIKNAKRRDEFLRACPEFVIVDEAHGCAPTGRGQHLRFELLRALAESPHRHMVFLTATPHSGNETAYYGLLSLLKPEFARLAGEKDAGHEALRRDLARHLVQRRRVDIEEWRQAGALFPRKETKELTYQLTGAWERFFRAVLDYSAEVVARDADDARRQRLGFWGTLALLRCAGSSPAAALRALRTRAGETDDQNDDEVEAQTFDGTGEALPEDDVEPGADNQDPALQRLIQQAEGLQKEKNDPKLHLLTTHLRELLKDGFHPVVFCRYIATAEYLGESLRSALGAEVTVEVVTGELAPEERRERVQLLEDAPQRLLIATDCLSEGINLQALFSAVVHYDLSWNPTRHEQREGRVDRFGQPAEKVRATLMYGANNPIDGVVLQVILRKAETIRGALGVPVPLPDEGHALTQALLEAVLVRGRGKVLAGQQNLDFGSLPEAQAIDSRWKDSMEGVKANRTLFAQRGLKPDEVLPEWRKALDAVGSSEEVQRFTSRSLARLGAALEPLPTGFRAPLAALPLDVRERLEAEGLPTSLRLRFDGASSGREIRRSHPLVAILAETLLSRSLAGASDGPQDLAVLGRTGAWSSRAVTRRTTIVLLRLRHQLQPGPGRAPLLVEEAVALAWSGSDEEREGPEALALLAAPAAGDLPAGKRDQELRRALELLLERQAALDSCAQRRAELLLTDHRRARDAAAAAGRIQVRPLLPADVIGLFVLVPALD